MQDYHPTFVPLKQPWEGLISDTLHHFMQIKTSVMFKRNYHFASLPVLFKQGAECAETSPTLLRLDIFKNAFTACFGAGDKAQPL